MINNWIAWFSVIIRFAQNKKQPKTIPRLTLTDKYRKSHFKINYKQKPWRDLPIEFGDLSAVYRYFNLWSKKYILDLLFNELAKLSDYDWVFADDSIIHGHQLVVDNKRPTMIIIIPLALEK